MAVAARWRSCAGATTRGGLVSRSLVVPGLNWCQAWAEANGESSIWQAGAMRLEWAGFKSPERALLGVVAAEIQNEVRMRHPNPLARYGQKVFSQGDEDGITAEIAGRIFGPEGGRFIEFGSGNGLENNTLFLTSLGWRGTWVDARSPNYPLPTSSRVTFVEKRITLDNVVSIFESSHERHDPHYDLMSMDLDGNDYHLVAAVLKAGHRPSILMVEYNVNFPPPAQFVMDYDAGHVYGQKGPDYYGASLASYVHLLEEFGYVLVCCATGMGANAFFVRDQHMHLFADVPSEISEIYAAPSAACIVPLTRNTQNVSPTMAQHLLSH